MFEKIVDRYLIMGGLDYYLDDEDMRDHFKYNSLRFIPLLLFQAYTNGWYKLDGTITHELNFYNHIDKHLRRSMIN